MRAKSRRIVLSANSDWNIANFRGGLIRALKEAKYEIVVIAPEDPAAENRMKALGVERVAITIERSGLNPISDLRLFLAYRRLLGRLRPAFYLSYTVKPNIYGCLAAALLGIPAIPNVSGLGTAFLRDGPVQKIVTFLYRLAFSRAPVVFFQNAEDRALFIERRMVRPEQARDLPGSGVDLKRFTPLGPCPGEPVFLFVGRLLRDKGVLEFVEAARRLRPVLSSARFQLLGPLDEQNLSAIGSSELQGWVKDGAIEYLGSTEDVRPFIAAATSVVLPSYREGLPRSLLEAGAMGRPLIASDVPGCRDVVEDGLNGFLCKVRDPGSLASAMRRLAELKPDERRLMGKASRLRIEGRFDEDHVIRSYLEVLAGLNSAKPAK